MSEYLTAAAKGCIIRATDGTSGYYRLNGFAAPGPVFIQSVSTDRKDIAAAVACFNDRHKFYVFGKGFGDIVVTLEAYLGNKGTVDTEAYVNEFFDKWRASRVKSVITVTSEGGAAYSFFLTGCRVAGTNPDINMVRFQLLGKIVE